MSSRVIFACIHNAGRSQMAAAFFNAIADPDEATAVSAGTEPATQLHPEVISAMQEVGIDLSNMKPQLLTRELAAGAQFLVTMGCGDRCPVSPGTEILEWTIEDPKGGPIERVREIREDIRRRVQEFASANGWGG